MVLGAVAGVGAWAFRMLIGLLHNLFFLGKLSFVYDSNAYTPPSPWGWGVVLVPALAGLLVVYLVRTFAPEAKGHGVPEVMDAIYYQQGRIRPVVAAVKSLASALSIGGGGSVGREGPIIQIGAAFSSWLGRVMGVSRWQLVTLIAAGGGAGIAATFNTPLGGVLFAVEVLLAEVSVRTLVPVALATSTATFVGQRLLGDVPAFQVPAQHLVTTTTAALLPGYLVLGAGLGLVSVVFIRALYGAEDFFDRFIPGRGYLRHVVGMLGVGLSAQVLMVLHGHYFIEGVGYATIADIMNGGLDTVGLLLALFALKLLATSLTLGSGASGGVFSPSLFMGATLGAAFGVGLRALFPQLGVDPVAFALAGMAGVVAGGTGAALTAIVMIFEMTRDYSVVLPMTMTVAVSYGLRRALLRESIYTMKLARRGHHMPEALQANAHLVHHVAEVALEQAQVLESSTSPAALALADETPQYRVLMDGDRVVGILKRDWLRAHPAEVSEASALLQLARRDFVTVEANTTLFDLMTALRRANARLAVVLGEGDGASAVRGVVSGGHLLEVIAEGMGPFAD